MPRHYDDKDNSDNRTDIDSSPQDVMPRHTITWSRIFCVLLIAAVLLSSPDLYGRLKAERGNRIVTIAFDYRDILSLSREAEKSGDSRLSPDMIYGRLYERGARGVTVAEFTGNDLASGALPVTYAPLSSFPQQIRDRVKRPLDQAVILADSSYQLLPNVMQYLRIRMPGVEKHVIGKQTVIVLPASFDELRDCGILPDFSALAFAGRVGAIALYRPNSLTGVGGGVIGESIKWLKSRYPSISCIIPAGLIVAGYPDIEELAAELSTAKVSVAQAEFIKQIGAQQLYSAMMPNVIPLHSIVRDELISRRMTRAQVVERMIRAVHERSIRIILMRPYDLYSSGRLSAVLDDTKLISDSLKDRGYILGWPDKFPLQVPSLFSALAFAAVFLASFWSYVRGYLNRPEATGKNEVIWLLACIAVTGALIWKVSPAARFVGGIGAAFVATEAVLWAMDRYKKPFPGLIAGLAIVLAGGLSIAAFYGSTESMLRLAPFSGVKLTLLLPPLMVLVYDLKRRIHHESLSHILRRPPLWGELLLCCILVAGALVLTLRSDNVAFVPEWEIGFRDMLERLLMVRPRTKEFLIGYPCLVIYYALIKRGWALHYREVFRVGASMAFASAINTFCHFHTLLPLTLMRVVNGWWLGVLTGFISLVLLDYICGPIWRKGGRELFE